MIYWTSALIFQSRESILLKGGNDIQDVLARELQAGGNALHMPALIVHAHDGPARPIGVVEFVKDGPGQGKLNGNWIALQEQLHSVMVGFVAIFPFDDANDFTVVARRVELFEIENVGCHWFGKRVRLTTGVG